MIDFVLISDKRTGSTFLQEALNSHPDIICHDELFIIRTSKELDNRWNIPFYKIQKKKKGWEPEEYLKWISHGQRKEKIGIRIVYPQLDHWVRLAPTLIKNNVLIIHLIRSNCFEQAMSWFTKGINQKQKVEVPPADLIWRTEKIEDDTNFYKKLFKSQSTYIFYENMFGETRGKKKKIKQKGSFNLTSNQKTFLDKKSNNKICNYLGISVFKMNSNITKRTSPDVWTHIQNKNTVYRTLKHKGWLEWSTKK